MILAAEAVTVKRGAAVLVDAVSLCVPAGTFLGLLGPNGAGKTSLLRALAGIEAPASGIITYDGRVVAEIGRRALGRMVSYLPQDGRIHWPLPVQDVVALGRLPHGAATVDEAVERAMAAAEVRHLARRSAGTLSGGERARVLLARALAVEAPVLLADEPCAALDPLHQLEVMALLRDTARRGAAVVAVLHDLTLAARFCDRLALMKEARLLAEGAPAEVLSEARVAEAFGVDSVRLSHDGETIVLPWSRHAKEQAGSRHAGGDAQTGAARGTEGGAKSGAEVEGNHER